MIVWSQRKDDGTGPDHRRSSVEEMLHHVLSRENTDIRTTFQSVLHSQSCEICDIFYTPELWSSQAGRSLQIIVYKQSPGSKSGRGRTSGASRQERGLGSWSLESRCMQGQSEDELT